MLAVLCAVFNCAQNKAKGGGDRGGNISAIIDTT